MVTPPAASGALAGVPCAPSRAVGAEATSLTPASSASSRCRSQALDGFTAQRLCWPPKCRLAHFQHDPHTSMLTGDQSVTRSARTTPSMGKWCVCRCSLRHNSHTPADRTLRRRAVGRPRCTAWCPRPSPDSALFPRAPPWARRAAAACAATPMAGDRGRAPTPGSAAPVPGVAMLAHFDLGTCVQRPGQVNGVIVGHAVCGARQQQWQEHSRWTLRWTSCN